MSATDSDEPDDLVPSEEAAPPGGPGGSGDPAGSGDGNLEVTGVQVAASTLASVSAAGVASLFGVHGTVIGAGVASVVATVGAAVYQRGLDRTSARLQEAPVAALVRPVVTRTSARLRGERFPEDPGFESWKEASLASSAASPPSGWRSAPAGRRWGVATGVGLVLVATLVVLSMFEVAAQRPLSGDDRGATSIGAVVEGGDSSSPSDDGRPDGSSPASSSSPSSDGLSPTSPSSPSSDGVPTTSGSAETEPGADSPTTAPDDPAGGDPSTTAGEDPSPPSTPAPESEAPTGSG
jgi:hypothetical protein